MSQKTVIVFGLVQLIYHRSSENITKSAVSKLYIQQLEQSIRVIIESCINQIFFVSWPLIFL